MITISFNRCCCCCCFALHCCFWINGDYWHMNPHWSTLYEPSLSLSIAIDWTRGLFSLSLSVSLHWQTHWGNSSTSNKHTLTHVQEEKVFKKKYKKNWSKHKVMKQNVMCVLVVPVPLFFVCCLFPHDWLLLGGDNQSLQWKKAFFSLDEREEQQCGGA